MNLNLAKEGPALAAESTIDHQANLEAIGSTLFHQFFTIPKEEVASVKDSLHLDCLPEDMKRVRRLVDLVDAQRYWSSNLLKAMWLKMGVLRMWQKWHSCPRK